MSVRLCSIVALAAAVVGCSTAQTKAERHLKAGDQFVVQGRNYAAVIEYLNAIKQTPSSVAYRKLGLAHLAAGDAGAAYRAFTKAVDLDPTDNEPRLEAARLLLRANMNDLAQVRAHPTVPAGTDLVELRLDRGAGAGRRQGEEVGEPARPGAEPQHLAAGRVLVEHRGERVPVTGGEGPLVGVDRSDQGA